MMRDLIECAFVTNTALDIAYDLSKKMIERNLKVDEVLFIERAGGTYSFEIKCSNRFTREQLKAKIKELMTDREQAIRKMSDEGFEYDPASGRFYKRMGSRHIQWVEITGKDDEQWKLK